MKIFSYLARFAASAEHAEKPPSNCGAFQKAGAAWVIRFVLLVTGLVAPYAGFMYWFDPFNYYHPESHWHNPNLEKGDYHYLAGCLQHAGYSEVIIGSSMSENFRVSSFKSKLGWGNPIKCTSRGPRVGNIAAYIRSAIRDGNAKKIFIGLDQPIFYRDRGMYRDEDIFPFYLYDSNPFNDIRYLLNFNLLKDNLWMLQWYFKNPAAQIYVLDRDRIFSTDLDATQKVHWPYWEKPDNGPGAEMAKSLRVVGSRYGTESKKTNEPVDFIDWERFETFVKEIFEANPNVEFYVSTPCYPVLNWKGFQPYLDQITKGRTMIFQRLLRCKNVKVYDPQSDPKIFCNLAYYWDTVHPSSRVNELILDGIASGEYLVTPSNIDALNERMKSAVLNFDPRPWIEGLDKAK